MASRPDRHAAATSLAVNLSAERSGSRDCAFLDVADGTDGLDVITANAEALAKHGVLGETWILPPPHSLDRMPLAELY